MKLRALLILLLFVFVAAFVYGQAPTKVGADKCKLCHKVEFASWQTTKHAAAKIECEDCHEEFAVALELGGTLSGEHGVGALKRPYMEKALGSTSLEIQKRIKAALDPLNILNPGKIFPD